MPYLGGWDGLAVVVDDDEQVMDDGQEAEWK